jgi:catechol-2,3-dioxygenase
METWMSFKVTSLDHVEVFVSDIQGAARWYEQVLGLTEIARWDPEPVMIGAAGTKLALFRSLAPARRQTGELEVTSGWRRVAWLTDKDGFKTAQEHLASLGIGFAGPQDHGLSRSIYFADPDGNPLEITFYL